MDAPVGVRLRLAHGFLEHLAHSRGIRLLHIKGVALHPLLRERRHPSTDCDVLVHPDDVAAFTEGLSASGWDRLTRFEHGSVFRHAATYHSEVWGTVDVHRCFPGIDRDPRSAFEQAWERREHVELGGRLCAVPDLEMQRLVLLLHAARDREGRRAGDVDAAWHRASTAERERIDALADRLGATVPLALATGRPERAHGLPGERVWDALGRGADPTEVWWARLHDARGPRARARVLVSALHVNPDHLRLRLGHVPTEAELRHEWWARWRRLLNHSSRLLRRDRGGSAGR